MQIVEFYKGVRPNQSGAFLTEIWDWTDGQLDTDHDWIQWVFPSNEPSMLNGDAPTLTKNEAEIFQSSEELQAKFLESFKIFLEFLDFKIKDNATGYLEIVPIDLGRTPWWLGSFNHTMLRVSRVLKSTRLVGLPHYGLALYNAMSLFRSKLSENTWGYWTRATKDLLWPE
jgi:hypothetical protein